MNIERDRTRGVWMLRSGSRVLWQGRRSPWEDPRLMRDVLRQEQQLGAASHRTR